MRQIYLDRCTTYLPRISVAAIKWMNFLVAMCAPTAARLVCRSKTACCSARDYSNAAHASRCNSSTQQHIHVGKTILLLIDRHGMFGSYASFSQCSIIGAMLRQIAAHGNSLRALVKHLDGISEDVITGLNIPTGATALPIGGHWRGSERCFLSTYVGAVDCFELFVR